LFFERHDAIHALAGMLAKNEQVDDIHVETESFDRDVWDAVFVPRLEINSYRKRFRAIQAIGLDKSSAAIAARALARIALADVKSESSLIFMVLSQNCDVFCSYLDEVLTRDNHISVPSRKRSRSPS
jgi:deoxyhypusine synthase